MVFVLFQGVEHFHYHYFGDSSSLIIHSALGGSKAKHEYKYMVFIESEIEKDAFGDITHITVTQITYAVSCFYKRPSNLPL